MFRSFTRRAHAASSDLTLCNECCGRPTGKFIESNNLSDHNQLNPSKRFGKTTRSEFSARGQFLFGIQPIAMALRANLRKKYHSLYVVSTGNESGNADDDSGRESGDEDQGSVVIKNKLVRSQLQWIIREGALVT